MNIRPDSPILMTGGVGSSEAHVLYREKSLLFRIPKKILQCFKSVIVITYLLESNPKNPGFFHRPKISLLLKMLNHRKSPLRHFSLSAIKDVSRSLGPYPHNHDHARSQSLYSLFYFLKNIFTSLLYIQQILENFKVYNYSFEEMPCV